MTTIYIKSKGQSLIADEVLTVNATVRTIECEFELDAFWDEYPGIEANFMNRSSREVRTVAVIGGSCEVPWEVLAKPGLIEVALKGVNETKVERSFPLTIVHLKETIVDGENSIEPTPDQYSQFVERVDEKINEVFTTRKDEFKGDPGEPGRPGAPGEPGEPGEPGKTPIKGVDYFTDEEVAGIVDAAKYNDEPIKAEINDVKENFRQLGDKIISLDLRRVGDKVYIAVNGIVQGDGVAIGDVPSSVIAILDNAILGTAVLG